MTDDLAAYNPIDNKNKTFSMKKYKKKLIAVIEDKIEEKYCGPEHGTVTLVVYG